MHTSMPAYMMPACKYTYMCVCMPACMFTYMHIVSVNTSEYICMHLYMHVCMCVCMPACVYRGEGGGGGGGGGGVAL